MTTVWDFAAYIILFFVGCYIVWCVIDEYYKDWLVWNDKKNRRKKRKW